MKTSNSTQKPIPFWEREPNRWQSILLMLLVSAFVLLFPLQSIWNTPISNSESHCKFALWLISTSKWNAGDAVINCLMDDGRLIVLNQPAGWLPPEIGSQMKIGVVEKRFFGEDYYLK